MGRRFNAGTALAGKSWRVLQQERWIFGAIVAGAAASTLIALAAFLAVFRRLPGGDDFRFPNYLVVVPFFWIVAFGNNCVTSLATIVIDARLRCEPITPGEALTRLGPKLGRVLAWTVVAGVIGLLLQVIAERLHLAGRIATWLVGLAWGLATSLVIPVLVLEDVPVRGSVRRSASLFKRIWAEKVAADITIGVVFMVASIPLIVVGIVLAAVVSVTAAVIFAVFTVAALVTLSGALDTVVRSATYRYAIDGAVSGPFTDREIRSRFTPK